MALFNHDYGYWDLRGRVTFDGPLRKIIINAGEATLSVKLDIYSAWKKWVQLRDNAKFPPALRTIGGDDLGNGKRAGDLYFLTNGWQVVVPHTVSIDGVLFHDDGIPPYIVMAGGGVTATVSNLVQTVSNTVPVVTGDLSQVAASVWSHASRTLTNYPIVDVPTEEQVAQAVRTLLAAELAMVRRLALQDGLVPGAPSVVSSTGVTAGDLTKTFTRVGENIVVEST